MKLSQRFLFSLLLLCTPAWLSANLPGFDLNAENVSAFIDDMTREHKFKRDELEALLGKARLHQSILDAISRPAESKPWYEYQPIFLTQDRIRGGVKFWQKHDDILQAAEQKFRVPPHIITAIIGVETRYGRHTGRYPVLDSLATLAFAYPPRSRFFRSELEHYLLMTREEKLDPLEQYGSYAGAMGMPQFISSSFRSYAVDFDNNGQRDLWNSPADAIGSVANYFHRHGWQHGQPVVQRVQVRGDDYRKLLNSGLKPTHTVAELRQHGVVIPSSIAADQKVSLMELEGKAGPEYWLGWNNFYVISRYNRSALYSLAVYQLSLEILEAME
ncbi:MAG: lytic murein transglycosylase B [Gammaproteobacteria bacterium]